MKFYLKINNDWVQPDLDQSVDNPLALNWTFDSLTNPMDYVSEYSYDFQIPKTEKNKQLFDHIELLDSRVITPAKFPVQNAFKYIIQTKSDTISNGTCYLKTIEKDYYVFALNGALYNVFNTLLNSGWDTAKADDDPDYLLLPDIDEQKVNATMIKTAWDKTSYDWAFDKDSFYNFITFVPMHQGLYEDFSSNKQTNGQNIADLPFDNDVNEWQMCQYRSYEQTPAVFVQKLWSMYQSICKTYTDYDLELDTRWYNATYEWLQNLVYILPKLSKDEPYDSSSATNTANRAVTMPAASAFHSDTYILDGFQSSAEYHITHTIQVEQGETTRYNFNASMLLDTNVAATWLANKHNPMYITHQFLDLNGNVLKTNTTIIVMLTNETDSNGDYYMNLTDTERSVYESVADEVIAVRYTPDAGGETLSYGFTGNLELTFNYSGTVTVGVTMGFVNSQTPFSRGTAGNYVREYMVTGTPKLTQKYSLSKDTTGSIRSNMYITYEDLFQDVSPFTILLQFSKIVGLLWIVDDYSKKIKVVRRADFFEDIKTIDQDSKYPHSQLDIPYIGFYNITNLVSTEDMEIQPLSWDSRLIALDYEDVNDSYMSGYKDKYGRGYGSVLINTANKHNDDTENLFCTGEYDKVKPSCDVNELYEPYESLKQGNGYKMQSMSAPTNSEGSDYGNFYFRCGNVSVPSGMHYGGYYQDGTGNYVLITDDSDYEISNGEYCWHNPMYYLLHPTAGKLCRTIPQFKTFHGQYHFQFAEPKELYYPKNPFNVIPINGRVSATEEEYIYDNEFADYFGEIYNVENKTLICNVAMDGSLFRRLKAVPLVIIKNVGYLVMEITDFNDDNELTKVTLRQISDYSVLVSKAKSKNVATPTLIELDSDETNGTADVFTDEDRELEAVDPDNL